MADVPDRGAELQKVKLFEGKEMNIWNILGIEPTKDIKIIKEAYAQKAKEKHPEEHPEEFKQLQAAYKAAIQYAKGQKSDFEQHVQNFQEPDEGYEKRQAAQEPVTPPKFSYQEPPATKMNSFDYDRVPKVFRENETVEAKFRRELEYMLRHPYMRQIPAYWETFFNKPEYHALMLKEDFRKNIYERLCLENYFFHEESRKFFASYWKQLGTEVEESSFNRNSILSFKRSECETKQEKQAYDSIWNNRQHARGENAEKYLHNYFQYAEMNEEKLREIYCVANEARNQKSRVRRFVVTAIVLIWIRSIIRNAFG